MGEDDKGLLEDLIGETLESAEEPETVTRQMPMGGSDGGLGDVLDEPGFDGDLGGDDDQLMSELVQRRPSRSNKTLLIMGVLLLTLGGLGAAVFLGIIPLQKILPGAKKSNVAVVKGMDQKKIEALRAQALARAKARQKERQKEGLPSSTKAEQTSPRAGQKGPPGATPGVDQKQAPGVSVLPEGKKPPQGKKPVAPPAVKEPVKVAAKPVEKVVPAKPVEPKVASAPKEVPKPVVKAPPQEPVKAPPPPKAAPVAKKPVIKAPTKPPPTAKKPPVVLASKGDGDFSIQVGAYLFKSSLKDPMRKLVQLGFQPEISVIKRKVPMNRVLVGKFNSKQVAQAAVKDLAEEKIAATVIKTPKGSYSALTGTYFYRKTADKESEELEAFGYDVRIEKTPVLTDMQEVRVGSYGSESEAKGDITRLKSVGLKGVVVSR